MARKHFQGDLVIRNLNQDNREFQIAVMIVKELGGYAERVVISTGHRA
jgi:hypothetical protein